MPDQAARNTSPIVTVALVILGVIFIVIGVVYLTRTAGNLPAFFPGHQAGSAHHHTKHGIVAFALAVAAWIGAWLTTGKKTSASAS